MVSNFLFLCYLWFWYQSDCGLIEWLWKYAFLCNFSEDFEKDRCQLFSKWLIELACETIWSWAFVRWEFLITDSISTLVMVCSYFLFLPGSILGDWYLFRILEFVDCTFLNLSVSSKLFILLAYSCCFSVPESCLTLLDPMDYTTPGFPVLHCLLEFAQTHVH